jgi:adenylate cyclase
MLRAPGGFAQGAIVVDRTDLKQRLAAILAADVAGYSRLMTLDDHATVAALDAARQAFRTQIELNQGRVIDMAGDSVLAVFETAIGAVVAAVAVQSELSASAQAVPADRQMRFRIGVHLGDVIEKADGTVYGDGVNIAARLEGLAEPGGISVSDAVHGAVRGKLGAEFVDQGEQQVKNIAHPVRAFKVLSARPSAPPPLQPPDRPSLAVLPFTNMSGDPEQEYFADGITEDIITDVSKISGLFVIARNSCFTYKHQSVDVKDVGRKFGVRHVLEGSVRRAGARVRINVQLIDAESGGHVWADRYDRDLEDIFLVQDEVTRKVVQTLEVTLTRSERTHREGRGKVDADAYDHLIRAKKCMLQFDAAGMAEARVMLQRALAIDPAMTQAYAYLAILGGAEYVNGWGDSTTEALDAGLALARKACEVGPFEAISHNALAITLMWLRRLDEAESAARRAVELDANFAEARGSLGNILHFGGKHEEALASLQHALRLDPQFNLWMHAQGRVLFAMQRYADAETMFKRRLIHMPGSDVTRAYLASLYGHTERPEAARQVWRELMEVNPRYTVELTLRVLPYANPAPLEQFVEGLRKAGLAQ